MVIGLFSKPPWDGNSPEWRSLYEPVEEESWARVISQAVDQGMFDVEAAFDAYSGRGSARMETEEAKSLYKQRGQTIERVFGDFQEHRNLRRFRGRGIARARTQLGLTALAHNVRILLKLRAQKKQEADHGFVAKTAA